MIIQIMLQMQCSIDIYFFNTEKYISEYCWMLEIIFILLWAVYFSKLLLDFDVKTIKTVKFKIHKQWAKPSCQTGKKSKKTENYLLDSFPKEIKGCPSMKPFVISICRLFTPCDPNYLKNKSATVHMILVVIIKKG